MNGLFEDLRHGLLTLAKNRGFAVVAILSLALGIGANTTIFTFLNAIFLQPLPVKDAATLAAVFTLDSRIPGTLLNSYPNYQDYRDRNRSFSSLLIYTAVVGNLTGDGDPRPLIFQFVSGSYFQTLGVRPILGRAFLPEEDEISDAKPVAIISYGLWSRQFGGDRRIAARTVEVNGRQFQVVGVAPREFQGLNLLNPAEVWLPMAMYKELFPAANLARQRRPLTFAVAGRLKPGVSLPRAEAEMQGLARELEQEYPGENQGRRPKLMPLTEAGINPRTRSLLKSSGIVLMIVAGLILLIACANVANLLLARAARRKKEIAMRIALGARRGRLIRQLLTESVVLALAGGLLGFWVAGWSHNVLWALRPPLLSAAVFRADLDARVLAFTLAVSLLTGILFGLFPALRATNPDLAMDLKERASHPVFGVGSRQPGSLLVASEVALCVVALIGAGLFLRSLNNAERIDPGFDADRLGVISFDVAGQSYSEGRGREFQRRVLERAATLPGVVSAALSRDTVLRVAVLRTVVMEDDRSTGNERVGLMSPVSPNYFRTMGIPLLRGRNFSQLDTQNAPRVAIVNEAAADRYWPGQDPIGKRFRFLGDTFSLEVIGVARNANYLALAEAPQALFYTSLLQDYSGAATLILRTAGDPEPILPLARREVQALDRNLSVQTSSVRSRIRNSLWAPRLTAGLLSGFGILALLLAILGVYGVISYSVNQRVREIGIRMALGATAGDVQMLIVRRGLALVTVGVVAGLLIAAGASRALQSLLLVSARDGLTFILVPCILILAAIHACWLPARRATRVDPAKALRDE